MIVKLLTEHRLEFLSLQGGCTGSSESTLVKIPNCWKSHALAQVPNSFVSTMCQVASHFTCHYLDTCNCVCFHDTYITKFDF